MKRENRSENTGGNMTSDNLSDCFYGARRRIRTTDTRIFNPLPYVELTTPYGENPPRTDQERKGKVENGHPGAATADELAASLPHPLAPLTHRGVTIIPYDLPGHYAWADDTTGAADLAGSVEEAMRQIDQMKGEGE